MPQRFETAVAHIALYQIGAVAMPLSMLFGPEALEYRLQRQRGASWRSSTRARIANLLAARVALPGAAHRARRSARPRAGRHRLERGARRPRPTRFTPVDTAADDPAVLIYTSGTTGPPKGALIPHRALIGNLSGFVAARTGFGFEPGRAAPRGAAAPGRVFWSPADWAWTGGLMDALLPTLYFGRAIVAYQGRFAPEKAFELMERHGVTHTFLFPTALKAMMKAVPRAARALPAAAARRS